jgi:hypothetical protein
LTHGVILIARRGVYFRRISRLIEYLPEMGNMKHAVSNSIRSSEWNKVVEVKLSGEMIRIERICPGGDLWMQ